MRPLANARGNWLLWSLGSRLLQAGQLCMHHGGSGGGVVERQRVKRSRRPRHRADRRPSCHHQLRCLRLRSPATSGSAMR
ncbi:Os12g0230500 [Oryza sativa Japonica Group]|uniref:Os12g0230500 protein n=1 Tax=Oryza sativa subsp. japonica TaxID=39947 RepID=C7J9N9_ORYSJ|nr:Os12g0230500 [Oryza sativa Japonica Group]|eukprot:NP_001176853.1 Os12g0230500 [Oryza sativa Japonica Group]